MNRKVLQPTHQEVFVPFGRRVIDEHEQHNPQNRAQADEGCSSEGIIFSPTVSLANVVSGGEQELYYRGKSAVWSVEGAVKQTFTSQSTIIDCAWANFKHEDSIEKSDLCILTKEELTIHCCGGDVFTITLPGPVSKIWTLPKGLFLKQTDTNKLWFLENSLREFSEVAAPDITADKFRICFASKFANAPFVIIFEEVAKQHWVLEFEYCNEAKMPNSSLNLAMKKLKISWKSQQYPSAATWIDFIKYDQHGLRLCMLQSESCQLVAFTVPSVEANIKEFKEDFALRAKSAVCISHSSTLDGHHAQKLNALVILTPELECLLLINARQVCTININALADFIQYEHVDEVMVDVESSALDMQRKMPFIQELVHGLQSKFVVKLSSGNLVCVHLQIGPLSRVTMSVMRVLELLLPKETYEEIFGSFVTAGLGQSHSEEEEWASFTSTFFQIIAPESCKESTREDCAVDSGAWESLLQAEWTGNILRSTPCFNSILLERTGVEKSMAINVVPNLPMDKTALLNLLEALHSVYEDCKLDLMKWPYLRRLLDFLVNLTRLVGEDANAYSRRYSLERFDISIDPKHPTVNPSFNQEAYVPPNIYKAINAILNGSSYSKWLPQALQCEEVPEYLRWSKKVVKAFVAMRECYMESITSNSESKQDGYKKMLSKVQDDDWQLEDFDRLPFGISLALQEMFMCCRNEPQEKMKCSMYALLTRQDLAANCIVDDAPVFDAPYCLHLWSGKVNQANVFMETLDAKSISSSSKGANLERSAQDGNDGMSGVEKDDLNLRFANDLRLKQVRQLLSSSNPCPIFLPKGMDSSHPEANNVQQARLWDMAAKTMALPVGRGAYSLGTLTPLPTEPFLIPKLVLSGTLPHQNNALISLDMSNSKTPNVLDWPEFHNGAAAGLQLARGQAKLTRTWIVYNKTSEPSNDHAGFLMALGLQGHLNCLGVTDLYRYLSQEHDMTTIGVLLGVSAAHLGAMDSTISKMLFLHIPARHPPHYPELDLSPSVQSAALVGVGLLYLESSHRIMTEVLLGEIIRRPQNDGWHDQECYALAAGIGLGLVNLGKGTNLAGLADMNLEGQLCYFMNGGTLSKQSNDANGHKFSASTYGSGTQVMEDNIINLNITSPASLYALGLMYMKTNDRTMASRFEVPDSRFALDFVRPDFILLRVLFKSLIMWNEIKSKESWIHEQLPSFLRNSVSEDGSVKTSNEDGCDPYEADLHTIAQYHVYALCGACLALGLRYAGSANNNVKKLLQKYIMQFLEFKAVSPDITILHSTPSCNRADKTTLEECICLISLSLSIVMAGTGDLDVLRLLRGLLNRANGKVARGKYSSSMAMSMAIGILFLGGGHLSFCTSYKAIASLLISLFPHFPSSTTDNRSHLQALRHLYVLATEDRCMETVDVDSWENVRCPLRIDVKDGEDSYSYSCFTPTILPEKETIQQIAIEGPRYWPQNVKVGTREEIQSDVMMIIPRALWDQERIYVKRRVGLLPYSLDKDGSKSMTCRSLNSKAATSNLLDVIKDFTKNPYLLGFAEKICSMDREAQDAMKEFQEFSRNTLHRCLSDDKASLIKCFLSIFLHTLNIERQRMVTEECSMNGLLATWNMKIAYTFATRVARHLLDSSYSVQGHQAFIRSSWHRILTSLEHPAYGSVGKTILATVVDESH